MFSQRVSCVTVRSYPLGHSFIHTRQLLTDTMYTCTVYCTFETLYENMKGECAMLHQHAQREHVGFAARHRFCAHVAAAQAITKGKYNFLYVHVDLLV